MNTEQLQAKFENSEYIKKQNLPAHYFRKNKLGNYCIDAIDNQFYGYQASLYENSETLKYFLTEQQRLGAKFEKVLFDNLWDLYEEK
jgi:hypothetical protein